MRQWFCDNCGRAKWVDSVPTVSDICVGCGEQQRWRCDVEPAVAFDLNVNDKRFLRSLRIDPDDPIEDGA